MALTLTGQCNIPRPAWSGDVLHWLHDHRCHRSPRFLFAAPRHRGAAADQPRHPCALAERAGPARARPRLSHALSRPVSRGLRALRRLHAGGAGRAEMVDRILLVHALEMSDDPEGLLREVWRVLAPSGRLMAVIPNRRGVWTRTDTTPFGHGRPYSRSQITQLLRQTWFTPTAWGEALFVPPVRGGWFLRSAMAWERVGAALSLPFAGVHIVEATKQVYRAIPAHRERTRLIPALEPVLVPSSLQR